MKIAIFVKHFPKLSETFILNQITGLIELGHDTKIFAIKKNKEGKLHQDILKYSLLDKVYYFSPQNKIARFFRAILLVLDYCFKRPLIYLKLFNILKNKKDHVFLKLLFFIKPFLKEDFDILHCHFGPLGIYGAYLKDLGINVKLITSFHGYDLTLLIQENGERFYDILFNKGDLFLPVNDFFKNKLVDLGCDKRKIAVHHCGIDMDKFQFHKKSLMNGEKIKFLTVGRLVEKKGHEFVIKAINRLVKKYRNIEYIIAGDGPLRPKLEKMTDELGLREYIFFMGAVSDSETVKLYKESHIFVLHSVTASNGDMEGTPVVLMEAQACGLPVISTYHSGIPEVVKDGESGFLIPERNVSALIEKMEYLISNPDKWGEMGTVGRKHIEKNYNISTLNKELEKKYMNLIKNKN